MPLMPNHIEKLGMEKSRIESSSARKHASSSSHKHKHSKHDVHKPAPAPQGKHMLHTGDVLQKRWTIRGLIGQGAHAETYRAMDRKLHKEVVIKLEKDTAPHEALRYDTRVMEELEGGKMAFPCSASGHPFPASFSGCSLLSLAPQAHRTFANY